LLCRFGFSFVSSSRVRGEDGTQKTAETKAAEQSTAALQNKPKAALLRLNPPVG
jgi:hypothetical protein